MATQNLNSETKLSENLSVDTSTIEHEPKIDSSLNKKPEVKPMQWSSIHRMDSRYRVVYSDTSVDEIDFPKLVELIHKEQHANAQHHQNKVLPSPTASLTPEPQTTLGLDTKIHGVPLQPAPRVSGPQVISKIVAQTKKSETGNAQEFDNKRDEIYVAPTTKTTSQIPEKANPPVFSGKSSSKFHGVSWHNQRKRWRAYIYLSPGKQKYLGTFVDQRKAAIEYDRAVRKYNLKSPLNFPDTTKDSGALMETSQQESAVGISKKRPRANLNDSNIHVKKMALMGQSRTSPGIVPTTRTSKHNSNDQHTGTPIQPSAYLHGYPGMQFQTAQGQPQHMIMPQQVLKMPIAQAPMYPPYMMTADQQQANETTPPQATINQNKQTQPIIVNPSQLPTMQFIPAQLQQPQPILHVHNQGNPYVSNVQWNPQIQQQLAAQQNYSHMLFNNMRMQPQVQEVKSTQPLKSSVMHAPGLQQATLLQQANPGTFTTQQTNDQNKPNADATSGAKVA